MLFQFRTCVRACVLCIVMVLVILEMIVIIFIFSFPFPSSMFAAPGVTSQLCNPFDNSTCKKKTTEVSPEKGPTMELFPFHFTTTSICM